MTPRKPERAGGVPRRRRAAPQPPTPPTPPSHADPPPSFTSPGGRTFTFGAVEHSDPRAPRQSKTWPIFYNGAEAGKLFQDENYGPSKPWHASTRGLYWKYASDAPTGIGFDVAAFATAEQALAAWGRSADQILDWSEGKQVQGHFGPARRQAAREDRRYPQPSPPPRHFVSPRAEEAGSYIRLYKVIAQGKAINHLGRTTFSHTQAEDLAKDLRQQGYADVHVERWDPKHLSETPHGGHRVSDFNTIDDLAQHARGEGATHIMHIDDEVHLYFRRSDGEYEKAEVWQKDGYWHTQAPGSRVVVQKPPAGAKPIGGRGTMTEARRSGLSVPDQHQLKILKDTLRNPMKGLLGGPSAEEAEEILRDKFHFSDKQIQDLKTGMREARGSTPRRRTARGAESAGEKYAQDQLQSAYFMDWVRDQLAEAADMDPSEVLPLETKADALEIAKNMLQQLRWDTERGLGDNDILDLAGGVFGPGTATGGRETVREFWIGFKGTLQDPKTREWLADELLELKGQMRGGMREASVVKENDLARLSDSDRIYIRGLRSDASLARHRAEKYRAEGKHLQADIQDDIAVQKDREALRALQSAKHRKVEARPKAKRSAKRRR